MTRDLNISGLLLDVGFLAAADEGIGYLLDR